MPRLNRAQKATRDLAEENLRDAETAIEDLLAFANVDPAVNNWRGWDDFSAWLLEGRPTFERGAPDPDFRLRELHGTTTADLAAIINGTFAVSTLTPITGSWTYTAKDGVTSWPPQRALDDYLLWATLHLLVTGGAKRLHRCERPKCGQFFLGKTLRAKYCSTACHDADAPRRTQVRNRANVRSYRAITSQRTAKKSIRKTTIR